MVADYGNSFYRINNGNTDYPHLSHAQGVGIFAGALIGCIIGLKNIDSALQRATYTALALRGIVQDEHDRGAPGVGPTPIVAMSEYAIEHDKKK